MTIIVTGDAGFIGSNFVFYQLKNHPEDRIVCFDKLTYAGNLATLAPVMDNPNFRFVKGDIADRADVEKLFEEESSENLYVDEKFLEKAEEEDFCFVEGENLAGYEGKITEIVLYKWNRDYPADVFFEVDLSKWRLEERKDYSGYSHEKITKEIYNRQGLL